MHGCGHDSLQPLQLPQLQMRARALQVVQLVLTAPLAGLRHSSATAQPVSAPPLPAGARPWWRAGGTGGRRACGLWAACACWGRTGTGARHGDLEAEAVQVALPAAVQAAQGQAVLLVLWPQQWRWERWGRRALCTGERAVAAALQAAAGAAGMSGLASVLLPRLLQTAVVRATAMLRRVQAEAAAAVHPLRLRLRVHPPQLLAHACWRLRKKDGHTRRVMPPQLQLLLRQPVQPTRRLQLTMTMQQTQRRQLQPAVRRKRKRLRAWLS